MPTPLSGFIATVCRNANTFGSPSWVPLIMPQDYKLTRVPAGTPDASDRLTDQYQTLPTRYKIGVDFDATWNKGAGLTALRTAFLARSVIDLAALDRAPATAGTGYRGEWAVTRFNLDFPLLGTQKASISIMPHGSHTAAQGVAAYTDATVAAGTPEAASDKRRGAVASVNDSGGNPITKIRDWKLNLEWTTWENGDRTDNFEKVGMNQLKVSAELNFIWDSSVAALVAFKTAFQAHSEYLLYLLDGAYATSGSWGYYGGWAVTDFSCDMPLTDGQKVTVKLEPHANASVVPGAVTI